MSRYYFTNCRADRMNERITIQKLVSSNVDSEGFVNEDEQEYEDFYKCWCCFQAISDKEYESARATNVENIVTFTIRYCNKIKDINTTDYRVNFKNKLYDIVYMYDVNNQHNWIDLKCELLNN